MNNEIKDLESKIKKYKEELKKTNNKKKNNNISNSNANLRNTPTNVANDSYSKNKRFSVSYNFKMESLMKNLEKKKNNESNNLNNNINNSINNKNNVNKFISDDKKIKEDTEDKDEKDSFIKSLYSERNISDDSKDISNNSENQNKNQFIMEEKVEKEHKVEEPIIKNIIINNISNNINNDINNNINNNISNNINNTNTNENESKKLNTFPNNEIIQKKDSNDEKQKKMSNALNRFKKKVSKQKEDEARKNSCVVKSNKINGMAKMLEKQLGTGMIKEEKKENKPLTDDESGKDTSDIVNIIKNKPTYKGRKRKPTLHKRFNDKKQDEE